MLPLRRIPIIALFLAASPLLVLADKPGDELGVKEQLLKARNEPGRYDRLVKDLKAFLNLSPAEQEHLRQLDRDLSGLKPDQAARLHQTLERYVDWLERLPASDRKEIESAPDATERLRRIKALRQKEWVERLPRAKRDQVERAQGEKRTALILQFRKEEQQRTQDWKSAKKYWEELMKGPPPVRLADLSQEAQLFVQRALMPRLTKKEAERLKTAEGKWPEYLQTLVELTDRSFQIPGPKGPRYFKELPPDVQKRLRQDLDPKTLDLLRQAEGKWPDYAYRINRAAKEHKIRIPPLGPAKPSDFPPNLQTFIARLIRELTDTEKITLTRAENQWPRYPHVLVGLARRHDMPIPGTTLPGDRAYWERYRVKKLGGNETAGN